MPADKTCVTEEAWTGIEEIGDLAGCAPRVKNSAYQGA